MGQILSERFILGLTRTLESGFFTIDYVDFEQPTDPRSLIPPPLPPGPALPLRHPVRNLSHLWTPRLPLPPGPQARPSPLRKFPGAGRHHHRLLCASGPGRAHARGRGGLAGVARGAAGTGGTEPAAPVGAEGGSPSEEE